MRTNMRKAIRNPTPLTLVEFIKTKIIEFETANKEITLGTLTDGIWTEYQPGETWNTILVGSIWAENPEFVTLEELKREYGFYEEQFENRMNEVFGFY